MSKTVRIANMSKTVRTSGADRIVRVGSLGNRLITVGTQGPAGVGFNWRGEWDSSTTYVENDVVEYNGSSFIATQQNTNSTPVVDNSNSDWDLWAKSGSTSLASQIHTQSSAAAVWTINHGLGRKPIVGRREDDNGNSIGGIIDHVDDNTFEVRFNESVAGDVLYI